MHDRAAFTPRMDRPALTAIGVVLTLSDPSSLPTHELPFRTLLPTALQVPVNTTLSTPTAPLSHLQLIRCQLLKHFEHWQGVRVLQSVKETKEEMCVCVFGAGGSSYVRWGNINTHESKTEPQADGGRLKEAGARLVMSSTHNKAELSYWWAWPTNTLAACPRHGLPEISPTTSP